MLGKKQLLNGGFSWWFTMGSQSVKTSTPKQIQVFESYAWMHGMSRYIYLNMYIPPRNELSETNSSHLKMDCLNGLSEKTIVLVKIYFIKKSRGPFGFNGRFLDFHGIYP